MGCLCGKSRIPEASPNLNFNGETKEKKLDPKDFMVSDCHHQTVFKMPNSIKGEQFLVQDCSDSVIYLLDHFDSLIVDDCSHCQLVIGPTKGSVFLRKVRDSALIVACGQFRLTDCSNVTVFLHCPTAATVESVASIHISCFKLYYDGLNDQLKKAGLNEFNNKWSSFYDFTPTTGEVHVKINVPSLKPEDFFPQTQEELTSIGFTYQEKCSAVPFTHSVKILDVMPQCCFLVFFNSPNMDQLAMDFIKGTTEEETIKILYTIKTKLSREDCDLLGLDEKGTKELEDGPTITIVLGGENVIVTAKKIIRETDLPQHTYTLVGGTPKSIAAARNFSAKAAVTSS